MPSDILIPQSSTSQIRHFMLRSSTTGQGLTGKVAADFSGKYNINGGAEVTLSFSSGSAGDAYSSGKICDLGLGKYAWHVPNTLFGTVGSVSAVLTCSGGIDVHFDWTVAAVNRAATAFGANTTAPATPTNVSDAQTAILAKLPSALVGGRIDASVGAMAADTLTASALAASAVTEIQSGLMTAAGYTAPDNAGIAAIKVVTDRLDTGLVADGPVYQFTANMLELGASGSFPSEAPADWIKATSIDDGALTPAKFSGAIPVDSPFEAY